MYKPQPVFWDKAAGSGGERGVRMLRIYFGDTDKDKDKFIFDQIASVMPSDVFLLVPDQFTLQAERNAFEYMNADALLELEIVSRSGFARRIVSRRDLPEAWRWINTAVLCC